MGIGTSKGAYYDDAFHQAAAQWDDKYDNNIIVPDTQGADDTANDKIVIDPSVKAEDFITPVANITNTPGEIMEGVEGVRMFPQGYGSRGGPTAQMRRGANDNRSDVYNPREPNMIGSNKMDDHIDRTWKAFGDFQKKSGEAERLLLNKGNFTEFDAARVKKLQGEAQKHLDLHNYLLNSDPE